MKKLILSALALLLGVFCVGSLSTLPVSAADDADKPAVWLQVSPVSKRLYLAAGSSYEDEFTVENIGSEDFNFKVYASPYSTVGENYDLNFTEETKYTQIARWIKFEQTEYPLAVGASQTVKFRVEVPADVPDGGQYAVIFSEAISSDDPTQSSGLKTIPRIGLVVYANMGGETKETSELTAYDIPGFYLSGGIGASAKIKNSGNTDFEVRHHLEIRPLIGDIVFEENLVQAVLPETERRTEFAWDKTPLLGIFKVSYSVTAPGLERNETRLVFVIPLFVIIITLLLLTSIIIWVTLRIKRRKGLRKNMTISE